MKEENNGFSASAHPLLGSPVREGLVYNFILLDRSSISHSALRKLPSKGESIGANTRIGLGNPRGVEH